MIQERKKARHPNERETRAKALLDYVENLTEAWRAIVRSHGLLNRPVFQLEGELSIRKRRPNDGLASTLGTSWPDAGGVDGPGQQ
jgi:hypothetical protein